MTALATVTAIPTNLIKKNLHFPSVPLSLFINNIVIYRESEIINSIKKFIDLNSII